MLEAENFQIGGAVRANSLYIERRADDLIIEFVAGATPVGELDRSANGIICIAEPHQSGKTSLYYRAFDKLQAADAKYIYFDVGKIISPDLSEIQWYYALAHQISEDLNLGADKIDMLWDKHNESPATFWSEFVKNFADEKQRIVILIDEFNLTESLEFGFDALFASVAAVGNASLVLLGVFSYYLTGKKSPGFSALQKTVVPLRDFTPKQMRGFAPVLAQFINTDTERTVREIYRWTNGHPYMSQRVCEKIKASFAVNQPPSVDEIVEDLFFREGIYSDVALASTNERFNTFFADSDRREAVLVIYENLLKADGGARAKNDLPENFSTDSVLEDLRVTGLISIDEKSNVRCRNEIYRRIFDDRWIDFKRNAAAQNE